MTDSPVPPARPWSGEGTLCPWCGEPGEIDGGYDILCLNEDCVDYGTRVQIKDEYDEIVSALRAEVERLQAERDALAEAQVNLAGWGAYAGEYFQTKWDLAGDLARIEDLLNSPAVQALPDTEEK